MRTSAIEVGMPPTGGWESGGQARHAVDQHAVDPATLFPTMKPIDK